MIKNLKDFYESKKTLLIHCKDEEQIKEFFKESAKLRFGNEFVENFYPILSYFNIEKYPDGFYFCNDWYCLDRKPSGSLKKATIELSDIIPDKRRKKKNGIKRHN